MRDYFYCLIFPHPKNNHRSRFLHFKSLLIVIALLVLSSFLFSSPLNPFSDKIQAFADISSLELLNFTNEKRSDYGLPPLSSNSQLELAANKKAEDMFTKDYWAHNSPDGVTPWVFIKDSGYDYVYAGENLARGFTDSRDVVNAWMASPEHRENMLSENFNDVGFAVRAGKLNGEDTFLIVQEFGNKTTIPVVPTKKIEIEPVPGNVLGFDFKTPTAPNFSISYEFTVILIFAFIAVLLVDLIVIQRKKIARFVGHNLDHAMYLLIIVLIITLFSTGAVI